MFYWNGDEASMKCFTFSPLITDIHASTLIEGNFYMKTNTNIIFFEINESEIPLKMRQKEISKAVERKKEMRREERLNRKCFSFQISMMSRVESQD